MTGYAKEIEVADLPRRALSVRQPWAHAIIHLDKGVENRAWSGSNAGRKRRGTIAIHAAGGMTRAEYEEARAFIDGRGWTCPDPAALGRGGIIGAVDIVDVVTRHDSPWFFGPVGLVLAKPRWCTFVPAKGALGFFAWQAGAPDAVPKPARWMLPRAPRLDQTIARLAAAPRGDLFEP